MFGLFRKKEGVDHHAHQKIDNLNSSVSNSFKNIKRDMDSVSSWLSHLKDSHQKHDTKLENIEKQLYHILRKLEHHEQAIAANSASLETIQIPEVEDSEEYIEEPQVIKAKQEPELEPFIIPKGAEKVDIKNMLTSLTETQKVMFIKLISLQRESGGWVPFKTLAEEIYPEKEYGDVRSTISEYLTLLSEWGLVTKKRTGKQSFVSVTSKGEEIIQHMSAESKKAQKLVIKKHK